ALFKDKHVVILPDNDAPGRRHAEQVARSLTPIAKSVKVVTLPELPDRGDVVDWYEERQHQGRSDAEIVLELRQLVDTASLWTTAAIAPCPLTDANDDEYDRFVDALAAAGCEPRDDGEKGTSRCPCSDNHEHGDDKPSLTFARGDKQDVVAKCHKGCTWDDIL